ADDEHPPLVPAADERRETARKPPFPEAREADEERAEEHVDEVHAAWEAVEGDGRPREEECRRLGEDARCENGRRVAGTRVAPHAAVEAEDDEEDVSGDEERRQREV